MKLSISRNTLKEATHGFAKVISNRSVRSGRTMPPILGCVRFDFDAVQGKITAEATNLDETARFRFTTAEDAKQAEATEQNGDGTFALPLQTLKELCKGGAQDIIEMELASDGSVVVTQPVGGHVLRRTVACVPVADWSVAGGVAAGVIPTNPAPKFLPTYRRVAPFASTDATRPMLNTVFVDISANGKVGNATLVACDGRRITACNSLTLPVGKDGVAVPVTKFLTWAGLGDEASIGVNVDKAAPVQGSATRAAVSSATWFALDTDRWSYAVRVPAGVYPNWRQVLPSGTDLPHRLAFTDADAEALRKLLPALPGGDAVAVLGSAAGISVAGRNKGDSADTLVTLAGGSAYAGAVDGNGNGNGGGEGQGARLWLNRYFLLDAFAAGFRNFGFHVGIVPVRSDDGHGGVHVLMPLRT